MGKRRGNNEGSIYQRPDGRWCARVSVDGRRLTKYFKTQRECREWLKETIAQVDDGLTVAGAKSTLEEFLRSWLQTVKPTVRFNTWDHYSTDVERHIIPGLGKLRLKDLRPDHIQAFYAAKLSAGSTAAMVGQIHTALHRALTLAVKWGLLPRNPAGAVEKPKAARSEMKTLTADQVRTLLAATDDPQLYALFHLAVNTGLREGELLALQWADLDGDTGALQVRRQVQRETGAGMQFYEPKSAAGRRLIQLGPASLARLRTWRRQQKEARLFAGAGWKELGLMFTTGIGTPLDPRNVRRQFKAVLSKAELPDVRFHDLRHTAATLMLQQGIHPKIVQERLGHSSISMTMDVYSHVLPSMQAEAAERLEALLEPRSSQTGAKLE